MSKVAVGGNVKYWRVKGECSERKGRQGVSGLATCEWIKGWIRVNMRVCEQHCSASLAMTLRAVAV